MQRPLISQINAWVRWFLATKFTIRCVLTIHLLTELLRVARLIDWLFRNFSLAELLGTFCSRETSPSSREFCRWRTNRREGSDFIVHFQSKFHLGWIPDHWVGHFVDDAESHARSRQSGPPHCRVWSDGTEELPAKNGYSSTRSPCMETADGWVSYQPVFGPNQSNYTYMRDLRFLPLEASFEVLQVLILSHFSPWLYAWWIAWVIWLTNQHSIDWLIDWMWIRLVVHSIGCSFDWLIDWFVALLIARVFPLQSDSDVADSGYGTMHAT